MNKKRTDVDYSKHEMHIIRNEHVVIHHLKLIGSSEHNVKFINCSGILSVTGDFGNWIFYRSFIPSPKGFASQGYWLEKLKNSSCQNPYDIDYDMIKIEVKKLINERIAEIDYKGVHPLDDKWFEHDDNQLMFLKGLYNAAQEENDLDYQVAAFRSNYDNGFDIESIPYYKKPKFWFLAVLDAFDEICNRL